MVERAEKNGIPYFPTFFAASESPVSESLPLGLVQSLCSKVSWLMAGAGLQIVTVTGEVPRIVTKRLEGTPWRWRHFTEHWS